MLEYQGYTGNVEFDAEADRAPRERGSRPLNSNRRKNAGAIRRKARDHGSQCIR